jgi:hypothetical protein
MKSLLCSAKAANNNDIKCSVVVEIIDQIKLYLRKQCTIINNKTNLTKMDENLSLEYVIDLIL